jgi:DNA helicase-2/ATP-dependent DNA helicase PcrA
VYVKKGGYTTARQTSYTPSAYSYASANTILAAKEKKSEFSAYSTTPSKVLDLNKGDMVEHTAFGRGMVLSVMKMGGDALLEIAFDTIGTKKLMAKTASAHMKKL